jgi:hypothetical protein
MSEIKEMRFDELPDKLKEEVEKEIYESDIKDTKYVL